MLISSISLGVLTRNKDFKTPLGLWITMLPRYLLLPLSFIVKQVLKFMKCFTHCRLTCGILADLVMYGSAQQFLLYTKSSIFLNLHRSLRLHAVATGQFVRILIKVSKNRIIVLLFTI